MPSKIKPKRSYTANAVPTTSDLDANELAINWVDGKAYTKNAAGNIVSVTLGGGGGSGLTWSSVPASATATGVVGSIAYDGSYFYLATASSTWVRAALSTWTNFSPASVTGLQAWYDASDASTLYDATSGGSLVSADGAVARWQDKSGNARHITQATSGYRPLRKTAVQGGLDVMRFDGTDDFMSVASSTAMFNFLHDGDATVMIVYKWISPSSTPYRRFLFATAANNDSSTGTTGVYCRLRDDFGTSTPYSKCQFVVANNGVNRANSYTGDNSFPSSTFQLMTISTDASQATEDARSAFRLNGGTALAKTNQTEGGTAPTGNASYNLHIATSAGPDGRLFAQLDVCEVCMYDSAISSTDRAAVESYLKTKWGIA